MSQKCVKTIRNVRSSHDKQTPIKPKFKLWGVWTPDLRVSPHKSERFPLCSHYDVSIGKQSQGKKGQAAWLTPARGPGRALALEHLGQAAQSQGHMELICEAARNACFWELQAKSPEPVLEDTESPRYLKYEEQGSKKWGPGGFCWF